VSQIDYTKEAKAVLAMAQNESKSSTETNEILTESSAAHWVKMSLSGFRKLRRSRRGPPFIRVGGSRLIRYRKADVEQWLSRHLKEA
jgi:predicted DNA-binding transcriptional regulator AlpA